MRPESEPFLALLLRVFFTVVLIAAFGQAGAASADSEVNDSPDVKYRQTLMSNVGSNMGAIGDILKKPCAILRPPPIWANRPRW